MFMYLYCLVQEAKERKMRSTDVTGHGECSTSLHLMKKPFSDVIYTLLMNRRVMGQVPECATVLKLSLFFNLKDIIGHHKHWLE